MRTSRFWAREGQASHLRAVDRSAAPAGPGYGAAVPIRPTITIRDERSVRMMHANRRYCPARRVAPAPCIITQPTS